MSLDPGHPQSGLDPRLWSSDVQYCLKKKTIILYPDISPLLLPDTDNNHYQPIPIFAVIELTDYSQFVLLCLTEYST